MLKIFKQYGPWNKRISVGISNRRRLRRRKRSMPFFVSTLFIFKFSHSTFNSITKIYDIPAFVHQNSETILMSLRSRRRFKNYKKFKKHKRRRRFLNKISKIKSRLWSNLKKEVHSVNISNPRKHALSRKTVKPVVSLTSKGLIKKGRKLILISSKLKGFPLRNFSAKFLLKYIDKKSPLFNKPFSYQNSIIRPLFSRRRYTSFSNSYLLRISCIYKHIPKKLAHCFTFRSFSLGSTLNILKNILMRRSSILQREKRSRIFVYRASNKKLPVFIKRFKRKSFRKKRRLKFGWFRKWRKRLRRRRACILSQYKFKSRKFKSRKFKSRKFKSRKFKSRKFKSRKFKSRKFKSRNNKRAFKQKLSSSLSGFKFFKIYTSKIAEHLTFVKPSKAKKRLSKVFYNKVRRLSRSQKLSKYDKYLIFNKVFSDVPGKTLSILSVARFYGNKSTRRFFKRKYIRLISKKPIFKKKNVLVALKSSKLYNSKSFRSQPSNNLLGFYLLNYLKSLNSMKKIISSKYSSFRYHPYDADTYLSHMHFISKEQFPSLFPVGYASNFLSESRKSYRKSKSIPTLPFLNRPSSLKKKPSFNRLAFLFGCFRKKTPNITSTFTAVRHSFIPTLSTAYNTYFNKGFLKTFKRSLNFSLLSRKSLLHSAGSTSKKFLKFFLSSLSKLNPIHSLTIFKKFLKTYNLIFQRPTIIFNDVTRIFNILGLVGKSKIYGAKKCVKLLKKKRISRFRKKSHRRRRSYNKKRIIQVNKGNYLRWSFRRSRRFIKIYGQQVNSNSTYFIERYSVVASTRRVLFKLTGNSITSSVIFGKVPLDFKKHQSSFYVSYKLSQMNLSNMKNVFYFWNSKVLRLKFAYIDTVSKEKVLLKKRFKKFNRILKKVRKSKRRRFSRKKNFFIILRSRKRFRFLKPNKKNNFIISKKIKESSKSFSKFFSSFFDTDLMSSFSNSKSFFLKETIDPVFAKELKRFFETKTTKLYNCLSFSNHSHTKFFYKSSSDIFYHFLTKLKISFMGRRFRKSNRFFKNRFSSAFLASVLLKSFSLLNKVVSTFLYWRSYKKHRFLIQLIKGSFKYNKSNFLDLYNFIGIKLKLKGKLSSIGGAKKRKKVWDVGPNNSFSYGSQSHFSSMPFTTPTGSLTLSLVVN